MEEVVLQHAVDQQAAVEDIFNFYLQRCEEAPEYGDEGKVLVEKTKSCWALSEGCLHFTSQNSFADSAFAVQVLWQLWHDFLLKYLSWVFLTSFQATVHSYKE